MHITILSFYSGQVERGVEVYVSELAERLSPLHEVKIINANNLPFKIKPYTGNENPLLRHLYLDRTSRTIKHATKVVLRNLVNNLPDAMYPVNNGWQSILAKKFCAQHNTKLILAGHSGPGWDDRVNLWLKPDAFITFSEAQFKWARGVSKKMNLKAIPHAVDTEKFSPAKSPLNLNLEKPIFLSVSALNKQSRGRETKKNVEATIRAVSKLAKGSLLLLGTGNDEKKIDELGKKVLGNRYHREIVSHNIIEQYYQAADVFALASSASEAFGLVYLEALACNVPVVTIDDNLRREIVGPAGILIKNPNNIAEYVGALETAAKKKWDNLPRTQALKYSWENSIQKYNELLEALSTKH